MIDLSGKTALIIGAYNQLAAGVGQRLEVAGMTLLVAVDDGASLPETLSNPIPVNLDDADKLTAHLADMPTLHTVIISPGWHDIGSFVDSTPDDWQIALRLNYERPVYAMQAAARKLIDQKNGGRIIYLSSAATLMPLAFTSVMATTLAMARPLIKMAAVELGKHDITVNGVAAGWLDADWQRDHLTSKAARAFVEAGIPVGRVGVSADIGDVCCFLASDLARYVTGTLIPVDGGYTLTRADGTSPFPDRL